MNSEDHVSIEGTLLMLDDVTPHVAVPVQVIWDGKVMSTVLSDERGRYQFVNLKPGQYQLRCHVLGGYVYYKSSSQTLDPTSYELHDTESAIEENVADVLKLESGRSLQGINFQLAPFKRGTWRNYDTLDGLVHNDVNSIHRDPDGVMWFGTKGGGVSRYDGKEFINLTTEDGLEHKETP